MCLLRMISGCDGFRSMLMTCLLSWYATNRHIFTEDFHVDIIIIIIISIFCARTSVDLSMHLLGVNCNCNDEDSTSISFDVEVNMNMQSVGPFSRLLQEPCLANFSQLSWLTSMNTTKIPKYRNKITDDKDDGGYDATIWLREGKLFRLWYTWKKNWNQARESRNAKIHARTASRKSCLP